jgi:hypothetical protein
VLAAPLAELFELKPPRRGLLVLGGRVIPLFAIAALQRDNFSHKNQPSKLSGSQAPSPAILEITE